MEIGDMFERDQDVISHALRMWANFIETGDVSLGITDAINVGEREKIQPLDNEQKKFCVRLRDLADERWEKK